MNLVNFEITRKLVDLDKVNNLNEFENVTKLINFENPVLTRFKKMGVVAQQFLND